MRRDIFIQSVYAGVLSSIVYALVQLVALKMGLLHGTVWNAAAGMFLPSDQIFTPLGTLIGLIGHLAVGGLWGIVFYVFLLLFGLNRSIYKGVLLGFYIWLFSTLLMRWGATSYVLFDSYEQLGALISMVIFGLSLGFLVPRMAVQDTSEPNFMFRGFLASKIAQPVYKPMPDEDEHNDNKT